MRKTRFQIAGAFALMALLGGAPAPESYAEVRVNVNLGPPPVVVAEPPEMVLVPGSQVYFVPEVNYDVFFFDGYWWSPRGDRWYRSRAYNGPWRVVSRRVIPAPVYRVPRDYRRVYLHERRVPYGQWKREWREHDRGRHGDRGERWEHDEHRGRGRD